MIIEKRLKAPPDIEMSDKDAERIEGLLKSRKMRLSDDQMQTIEKDLEKKYDSWQKQTTSMRRRLIRYNDMIEGVVQDTNFPFEGSSNITLHYAAGISRTFRATFNKTMYQDEDLFTPVLDSEVELDSQTFKALQDGFNRTFSSTYNGLDNLKEGTLPALRDGTVIVSASWERRVETGFDQRTYRAPEEFIKDYQDAETAGIDQEEYQAILDSFIMNPDDEIIVNFKHDFVEFEGIEYRVNSFAKFVFYPTFATSIKRMELYGNEYHLSESEARIKFKKKQYYERGYNKLLKTRSDQEIGEWDRARTMVDGISPSVEDSKPIRAVDLVYKYDLNNDGIPEKYLVTYAPESRALLSCEPYPLRRNIDICVAFRMIKRENRFPGVSLVGDCEDLFNQLDTLHRHRNNVRMLSTSPIFIANKTYKEMIDIGRADNVIRPGLTFWCEDINNTIKQLEIADLSAGNGDSMDEEMSLKGYIELTFGPTQGQSGAQTPSDPHAPARKTQLLLMQANGRIDDYADEWRGSMADLATLHGALLFQYYGKKEMPLTNNDQSVLKFPVQLLGNDKIKWKAKRRSVNLTPEFAMQRTQSLTELYLGLLPRIMSGDPIAVEMWNRQVMNSGEPESEKLMITPEQAQQMAQQAQQAAQAQQQQETQAEGRKTIVKEVGKHVGKQIGESISPSHKNSTPSPVGV